MIVRTPDYASRWIFGGRCPYTDEICDDWVCEICPVKEAKQGKFKDFERRRENRDERIAKLMKLVEQLRQSTNSMIDRIYDEVNALTIDAKPIIHAHWTEKIDWQSGTGHIHYTCSNCGYTVRYKPGTRGDGRGGKFCDDCGAMMDEKSEAK